MIEIKHVQQPTSQTCAHACLAMVTGLPVEHFMERFKEPELGLNEETIAFIESHIYPRKTDPYNPYPHFGIYLVTTPSLNQVGRSHAIIVEAREDSWKVYDPNAGRPNMNVYTDDDVMNGKVSQDGIYYLDYETLRELNIPKIDDVIRLMKTNIPG